MLQAGKYFTLWISVTSLRGKSGSNSSQVFLRQNSPAAYVSESEGIYFKVTYMPRKVPQMPWVYEHYTKIFAWPGSTHAIYFQREKESSGSRLRQGHQLTAAERVCACLWLAGTYPCQAGELQLAHVIQQLAFSLPTLAIFLMELWCRSHPWTA